MNCSAFFRFVLVILLFLLSPQAAVAWQSAAQEVDAQAVQPQVQAQVAEPEAAQVIEEGEIPTRAEHVEADLRRIETLTQPAPEIARIESALAAREVEIVALRAELDAVNPNQISPRRLEELRLPWLQLDEQLSTWSSTVGRRFDTLRDERERLRQVRALWERTAGAADGEDISPEMRQRVDTVLTLVVGVEARVRERRNEVGTIAGRITSGREVIADSLHQIDAIAVVLRARLFSRDAPPLWRSLGAIETRSFVGDTVTTGRDWVQALVAFTTLRLGRAVFLFMWIVVLLAGALRLRQRSSNWSAEDESEGFRKLIDRPFSLALAFALVASRLIVPYPIGSAADVLTVLAILPIVRLGSAVLPSTARRHLYGIAGLTVLGRVAAAGTDASLATRLLVLLVGILGFLGATMAAVRGRKRALGEGGWARATHLLLAATAIILAVSVVANILGWVQLSKMLTDASIASLFAALGWVIVVTAIAVLLPPVIHGKLGHALPGLRRNEARVVTVSIRTFGIVGAAAWLQSTLSRFQLWGPLREFAARMAMSELAIGSLIISTGGLLGAVLILLVTWLIARLVRFLLAEEVLPRLSLSRGSGQSLVTLVNYAVFSIGIMMAASAMGLTGTQLAVVVGALSLGIGFGLQNIVNNFVSGLILIFERPIKVGDTVQTADHWGKVQHIGIRASTIRSFDGAEIVVPNGDLIAKEVINWTRTDEIRRAEVLVGVAYGTDPDAVVEVLLRVAGEHPKVRAHPQPKAHMIRFGDSSLEFRLRCWTLIDDWIDLLGDLHVAVNRELKTAGITIPFPQRDLHVIPRPDAKDPDMPSPLEATDAEDQPE